MDMETLMAQAQDLQTKITVAQDSLGNMQVRGIAGNGDIVVTMTGKYDVLSVAIQPDVLANNAQQISEMVTMAYRDAKSKADVLIENVMNQITAGDAA